MFIFWMSVWVCQIFVLSNLCAFVFCVPNLYVKIKSSRPLRRNHLKKRLTTPPLSSDIWLGPCGHVRILERCFCLTFSVCTGLQKLRSVFCMTRLYHWTSRLSLTWVPWSLVYLSDASWWLSPPSYYPWFEISSALGIEMQGEWYCWAQHLQGCWWFLNPS